MKIQDQIKHSMEGKSLREQLALSEVVLGAMREAVRDGTLSAAPIAMGRLQQEVNQTRKLLGLRP